MRYAPLLILSLAACGTTPPPADLPVELAAAPLQLTAGAAVRGQSFQLSIQGARPGATIYVLYSLQGQGSGPAMPLFGGLQPPLAAPVRFMPGRSVLADANGNAVYRFDIPADAPVGLQVSLVAIERRGQGGSRSRATAVVEVEIAPVGEHARQLIDVGIGDSADLDDARALDAMRMLHTADLQYTGRVFEPRGGTALAVFGPQEPTASECEAAALSATPVLLADVPAGHWVCARTGDHRTAAFRMEPRVLLGSVQLTAVSFETPGAMEIADEGTLTVADFGSFDAGMATGQNDADFAWQSDLTLIPVNGARMAPVWTTPASPAHCEHELLSLAAIDEGLAQGQMVCARTASGAIAGFTIVDANAQTLTVDYTLWQPPNRVSSAAEPTVMVDPTLPVSTMPGLTPNDPPRALATLTGPHGEEMIFVEDELLVMGAQGDVLAWAASVGGIVLTEASTSALGGQVDTFLVRVVAPPRGPDLGAQVQAIRPGATGVHTVSSDAAADLMGLAAASSASALTVGLNIVTQGHDFREGRSDEAASAPMIAGYDRDAATWPHLRDGGNQDMDVIGAWRDLEVARRLDNRVGIMVFDQGFTASDAEFAPLSAALSQVPGHSALGQPNITGCGGSPCLWHGRNVGSAVYALADNDFGSAGPAGPVADPMSLFTLYDAYSLISALVIAGDQGAQIVNMSYGGAVPSAFDWGLAPSRIATQLAADTGTLLFASAGNGDVDVDDEDCFLGVCWEGTFHTPCENEGVICVGALEFDGRNKASYSNWGRHDVDLWAPGTVHVGPDPQNTGNRLVSGTSFASPYAAGVAALVWAADPSQSNREVMGALASTTRPGGEARVDRVVQPRSAVESAAGAVPPFLEITSPVDGSSVNAGIPGAWLEADAEAFRGGVTVSWTSDIDGDLGLGDALPARDLTPGLHTIVATATDGYGRRSTDTVEVTIDNPAPTVQIVAPTLTTYFAGEAISLAASSVDTNEPADSAEFSWFVNGGFIGLGANRTWSTSSPGTYVVRVVGADAYGAQGEDTITLDILPEPVDLPPSVSMTSPSAAEVVDAWFWEGHDGIGWYVDLTLRASATDPEDGALPASAIVWTVDGVEVGTGTNLPVRLHDDNCFGHTFEIIVTVTDSGGNVRTDVRYLTAYTIC